MNDKIIKDTYKKFRVPDHIASHMKTVAKVSLFIAKKITTKNPAKKKKINLKLLKNAALLHDIVKICDFSETNPIFKDKKYVKEDKEIWLELKKKYHNLGHISAASEILTDMGEPELARIIDKHRFTSIIDKDPANRPETLEEKILYYADKRVMHDKIVSIGERLKDGRKRYIPNDEITDEEIRVKDSLLKLEQELCEMAGMKPEDIRQ